MWIIQPLETNKQSWISICMCAWLFLKLSKSKATHTLSCGNWPPHGYSEFVYHDTKPKHISTPIHWLLSKMNSAEKLCRACYQQHGPNLFVDGLWSSDVQ
jgi:hypothetical protein